MTAGNSLLSPAQLRLAHYSSVPTGRRNPAGPFPAGFGVRMSRVAILLLGAVALGVGGVLGWKYVAADPPAGPPDWPGTVTAVVPGRIMIRLDTAPPADPDRPQYRECVAEVADGTPVRRGEKTGSTAALRSGQTVRVWCNGSFTSTSPMTRPAGYIVIEKE